MRRAYIRRYTFRYTRDWSRNNRPEWRQRMLDLQSRRFMTR